MARRTKPPALTYCDQGRIKTVELGEAELAWERAALERYVQASAEREGPASVTARLQFP